MKDLSNHEGEIYFALPIAGVLILVIMTYLLIAIGHTRGKEGIDTNDLDKIPLEILILIATFIIGLGLSLVFNTGHIGEELYKLYISVSICIYFVIYTVCAIITTTFIKRIKAKTLMKTTITGMILKFIGKVVNKIDNSLKVFTDNMKNTWKLITFSCAYVVLIILIFAVFNDSILGVIVNIGITVYLLYKIIQRINCFERIEMKLKDIYEGNNKERLYEDDFTKEFKNIIEYINDISNGFENAIQEGIKSERLKTELITNVSHDIKTPLTSIINYVDLLKRENIENDKAKEYIEILENKSQRLKRLTEDLVEASKASSGNVKLNLEKINIVELINQTTGEFEDKFKEKGLDIITSIPEEEANIEADSRYMYRIIENTFSNISKYALEHSRVYIDITADENKVRASIKNISAAKLNISTEELMQRFVRGDKSRTTEGSGLRIIYCKKFN